MKLLSNEQLAQIRADFPPGIRVVLKFMDGPFANNENQYFLSIPPDKWLLKNLYYKGLYSRSLHSTPMK